MDEITGPGNVTNIAKARKPKQDGSPDGVAAFLADHGFNVGTPSFDGKIERCARSGKSRKSSWYIAWASPRVVCVAGDWSTGEKWEYKAAGHTTKEERAEIKERVKRAVAAAKAERERMHQTASAAATATILACPLAESAHPYLERKGVQPFGIYQQGADLLIPVRDMADCVWGYQRIRPDGKKLFLTGQRVEGCFHLINGTTETVFVAEGYATGATVHQATGSAVYCAFHAGNLAAVAQMVRRLYPDAAMVVAGDDDQWSIGNPGRSKATEAAADAHAIAVFPLFADKEGKPTDFNDLFAREGLESVTSQLRSASIAKQIPVSAATPTNARIEGAKKKDMHARIAGVMIDPTTTRWPPFPAKLHRCVDHKGQSLVYEENDRGIVRLVADGHVDHLISEYWTKVLVANGVYLGTMAADDMVKTRKLWLGRAPGRVEPFPVLAWKSDPRPAHHRMAFDPFPSDMPTPRFDELMAKTRTTNSSALRAWIGSLFDENSQRQQYVWIYGDGANGKGTLVRCLMSALGSAAKAEQVPAPGDRRFWTMGLLGARLITLSDCDNPEFVASGMFKGLSGEDRMRVELKGGAILSLDMPVKFLFTSNEKPEISGGKSDTRRIIYCAMGAPARAEADFETAMLAETPSFLSNCWHHYLEVSAGNPRHVIKHDKEDALDELVATTEHEHKAFVDGYLRFDRDEKTGRWVELQPSKHLATRATDMKLAMIAAGFRQSKERSKLRAYLEQRCGIKAKSVRIGNEVFWGFDFLTIKVGTT